MVQVFAVELIQRDAAPAKIEISFAVFELHVHHDRVRLLDAADLSELNVVAESGGEFGARSVRTQVSGRESRQQEKQDHGEGSDAAHQKEAVEREPTAHLPAEVALVGNVSAMNGFDHCAANFHRDESVDRKQQKHRKDRQEAAADRQHRSRKDGKECQHGKIDIVARLLNGEELDDESEEYKMNGRCNVTSGNQEEVTEEDEYVEEREVIGPANGDLKVAIAREEISAEKKSACDEKRRGPVEASGSGEGEKSSDNEKKE